MKGSMNRRAVLDDYPFVHEHGRTMVVGTDIDALLSAAYMQTYYDWELVGFYDLTNVYYDSSESVEDAVWLDLDVARRDIESVGHHILTESPEQRPVVHERSLNPNLVRGVGHSNYSRKYPLSTLNLLLWLDDFSEPVSYEQACFCWLADSAWINGQTHRFKDNVQDWVSLMENSVFDAGMSAAIDTDAFESVVEHDLFPAIKDSGFTIGRSQVESRHRKLKGHQCSFNDPREYEERIQALASLISQRLPFERLRLPDVDSVEYGTRSKEYLSQIDDSWGGIDGLAESDTVFSYAETFPGQVNYTMNIDL